MLTRRFSWGVWGVWGLGFRGFRVWGLGFANVPRTPPRGTCCVVCAYVKPLSQPARPRLNLGGFRVSFKNVSGSSQPALTFVFGGIIVKRAQCRPQFARVLTYFGDIWRQSAV